MPIGLSYPGLRCVLEHLDAVKRQATFKTFKIAVLQRSEKTIPLRLNYLQIYKAVTSLDDFSFDLREFNEELQFSCDDRKTIWKRNIPQNLDTQTVENKINQYYMGGRTSVYVKRLEVFGPHADLALPVDSKFKVTELDAKHCNFEYYLPIIDPISFPLKYLRCKLAGLHTYYYPVFRSAESLSFNIFEEQSEEEMICLHKLPCKTI
ncbi:hypothetical protein CRE_13187 [Caenorhabditis remanei]|uniref:DUF38 domain-containing protein n=1 Tax=Caenorhabditis remanei TaxID=31234 RepID=E3NPK6_CAERE|nr:hypothetical protein CRE_13187 [Caenorhabditis remanei]